MVETKPNIYNMFQHSMVRNRFQTKEITAVIKHVIFNAFWSKNSDNIDIASNIQDSKTHIKIGTKKP